MNNHLVPKLILKRFSESLNVFNLKTGEITERKNIDKLFREKDKYTDSIEDTLNKNIESRFANLLDDKITSKEEISISREELHLIKRYMLTMSIRTLEPEHFYEIIKEFEEKSKLYILLYEGLEKLPSIADLNIDANEYYLRTLEVFSKTSDIDDIKNNKLATKEMVAWARPFLESYVAFWDAPDDAEFIISDNGMTSEYEGFHLLTGGLSHSKYSYLMHKITKDSKPLHQQLATTISMYENYNLYVLSSKRALVMINPFFSLYDKEFGILDPQNNIIRINAPSIWPAIIQNRELFIRPKAEYVNEKLRLEDDTFKYKVSKLKDIDLIYINHLILSQAKELVGFNNVEKIMETLLFNKYATEKYRSVYKESNKLDSLYETLINKYNIKIEDYNNKNKVLFDQIITNIFSDYNSNEYLIKNLLDREVETIASKNLDFMGKGKARIYNLKRHLNKIQTNKKI